MPEKNSIIPQSIDNAVTNLTDLPTKNVGQTISDCWYLVFSVFSHAADKRRVKYAFELEQFKKDLEKSLDTVSPENRTEPSTQIVMSALNDAKYCVEEKELRDMFVSLISSATDIHKSVHPSFSNIIKQMSPADATLLNCFKPNTPYALCDLTLSAPIGYIVAYSNLFLSGPTNMDAKTTSLCLSSLIHLGLLEIRPDISFADKSIYEPFKDSVVYQSLRFNYPDKEVHFDYKVVQLTALGNSFVSCCCPN